MNEYVKSLRNANDWPALQEAAMDTLEEMTLDIISQSDYERADRERDMRQANCQHLDSGIEEMLEGDAVIQEVFVCYDCGAQR